MNAIYKGIIRIEPDDYLYIKKIMKSPASEDECFSENETYVKTYVFADGKEMDIKICGVQYRDGEDNSPWTEAVLFDENGCELACTEPSDDFFGDWVLECDGCSYFVTVKESNQTFLYKEIVKRMLADLKTWIEDDYNSYELYLTYGGEYFSEADTLNNPNLNTDYCRVIEFAKPFDNDANRDIVNTHKECYMVTAFGEKEDRVLTNPIFISNKQLANGNDEDVARILFSCLITNARTEFDGVWGRYILMETSDAFDESKAYYILDAYHCACVTDSADFTVYFATVEEANKYIKEKLCNQ